MGLLHHETLCIGRVGKEIGTDEAMALQHPVQLLGDATGQPELPPSGMGSG